MPDKDCQMKIFHNEPFHTPNNYDIYFEKDKVPSNIQMESSYNIEKKLQKLMPLTKKIHLKLGSKSITRNNSINIFCKLKINDKEVKFI